MQRALLQENVGLVDEDDCVPACRYIEYPLPILVEIRGFRPEVPASDDIQGTTEVLAGGLRGERLPDSGRAEEIDD